MTETIWARLGLSMLFGLAAFVAVILALAAFAIQPALTIAFLLALVSMLGVFIYDARSEDTNDGV